MFQEIEDQCVNTVSFGSGDVPLVGISGSFGTWEIWQQPFELLSTQRRVIGYDHYGTGETRVSVNLVNFENQVDLLGGVLDTFEVDRCILAGDSSMTTVALEAARRCPQRVTGLVLVSAGIDYTPDDAVIGFVQGLRHAFDATVYAFVELCLPEDDSGHLRLWLRDIIARTGGERAAQLVESFYEVDMRPHLRQIETPTLVIHGALDVLPTSRLSAAEELTGEMPNAELMVLADAGHVPTLSRPDEVALAIDKFITTST
ncbi:MAG: alpha/beta hydrolase [Acidimicrobiia bacterium]